MSVNFSKVCRAITAARVCMRAKNNKNKPGEWHKFGSGRKEGQPLYMHKMRLLSITFGFDKLVVKAVSEEWLRKVSQVHF